MARIVVTRLRLRDAAFFDAFLTAAFAVVEQAQASDGNAAADVLAEANQTYWTRTAWRDKEAMRKFMVAEPHRSTMDAIDEWCDEATFASWDQPDAVLPQWSEAYTRLVTEGSVVDLAHASADNESRRFPAPVLE
jgi:heme-degrading monooxygenase HmoA